MTAPAEFPVPEAAVEAVNDKLWPLRDGFTTLTPHRKHNYEQGCAVCEEEVPEVLAVAGPHIAAAALRQAADEYQAEVEAGSTVDGARYLRRTDQVAEAAGAAAWLRQRAEHLAGVAEFASLDAQVEPCRWYRGAGWDRCHRCNAPAWEHEGRLVPEKRVPFRPGEAEALRQRGGVSLTEPADDPTVAEQDRPLFTGHAERTCGPHRTVGPHRAWCHDCGMWCYPQDGCRGCARASLPEWERQFLEQQEGRCGHLAPPVGERRGPAWQHSCALPAGHRGWHRAEQAYDMELGELPPVEWNEVAPDAD